MLGVVFGWGRRKLESGLGCISVRGRRNKESVLGGVMEMGRGWMGDSGRGMMLFEIEYLVVDWDV